MPVANKINHKRIHAFILLYGLFSGLLLSINLLLTEYIGYWNIYTGYLFLFCIFFFLIKAYRKFTGTDLKILNSILIGFPIFLITLAMIRYVDDYGGTIVYTSFGKRELVKELLGQSLVFACFLGLVFLPVYRWIRKKV